MDSEKIINDLNRRFAEPLPEYYRRRIIVWHDEDGEFKDRLEEIELENAIVVELTGRNMFSVKKLIAIENTTDNILLYNPCSYDAPINNWLLDVELYSEEFRADIIAIWMNEMHIKSDIGLRQQIKNYKKFFNAKPRRDRIARFEKTPTNTSQLNLAMMAAAAGLLDTTPAKIIYKVLYAGLKDEENSVYKDYVSFGIDKMFWDMVAQGTGYYVGEEAKLEGLFEHIVFLAFASNYVGTIPEAWTKEGSDRHKAFCFNFISEWSRNGNPKILAEFLQNMEKKYSVKDYLAKQQVVYLENIECFTCVNEAILQRLLNAVSEDRIDIEKIRRTIEKRRVISWYRGYADIYEGLNQLANMQEFYLTHSGGFHLAKSKDIWKAYTQDYYKMDQYYRKLHLAHEHYLLRFNENLNDLYSMLIDKAEKLYNNWYLESLGENWTSISNEELAKQGYVWDVPKQTEFYRKNVLNAENRVFVIISDAMRYEVGMELVTMLERKPQSKVKVNSQQAMLPTITKFGMAALLPHGEFKLAESQGVVKVMMDETSTDSSYREQILQRYNPLSKAFKYSDLIGMKSSDRKELMKGMKIVYIYHDTIDEASHNSDTAIFDACQKAVDELSNFTDILVKEMGSSTILITSDHGFIYTYSPLHESNKLDKAEFKNRIIELSRRYVFTKKGEPIDYLQPIKLQVEESGIDAYAPKGNVRIKSGGGMKFVHGGTSLQEMVVPVIEYKHVSTSSKDYKNNKDNYDIKKVGVTLLTSSHKISNRAFSLDFYQTNAASKNYVKDVYKVYFVDDMNNIVSDVQRIIADKTSENGQDRVFKTSFALKPLEFNPRSSYYLVIESEDGLDMVKEEFSISIVSMISDDDGDKVDVDYFG